MPKQTALAYAIAGLAVAAALLVVLASSTGIFEDKVATEAIPVQPLPPPALAPAPKLAAPLADEANRAVAPALEQPVEYVYVDEPAPAKRRHDDDDDDDDERESDDD